MKKRLARRFPELLFVSICFFNSYSAVASPLYQETFSFCQDADGREGAYRAGWAGYRASTRLGKPGYAKIYGPGSPTELAPLAAHSDGGADGFLFWPKNTKGLFLITKEISPIPLPEIDLIHYEHRLDGVASPGNDPNDGTQLALLVNGRWYVSKQIVRQHVRGGYELVVVDAHAEMYSISFDVPGYGPTEPDEEATGVPLPTSGYLEGLGVYLPRVTGKVRIDNVGIQSASNHLTASDAVLGVGECRASWYCPQVDLQLLNANVFSGAKSKRKVLKALRKRRSSDFLKLRDMALAVVASRRQLGFFAVSHLNVGDVTTQTAVFTKGAKKSERALIRFKDQLATQSEIILTLSDSKKLISYLTRLKEFSREDFPLFPHVKGVSSFEYAERPLCASKARRILREAVRESLM